MEITPKAMEIEYIRIKRLNQEREKAYAIELDAIGWHFIPMAGYYFSSLDSRMPRFLIYNGLNDWGKGREMPKFAKESFNEMWKKGKVK